MIIRRRQTSNYTALPNIVLTDERISIDARWCLAYLLSKPHDWQVQITNIQKVGRIGKDKARKLIAELISTGWIVRSSVRSDDGTFGGYEYVVSDSPSKNVSPETETPEPENPALDGPGPGNKALSNKGKKLKTDKIQNTEEYISAQAEFDEFWAAYPKRPNNPKAPAAAKYRYVREKIKIPHEALLQAAKAYAATREGEDPKFTAQTVTWLNQRRWEEEHEAVNVPAASDADLDAIVSKYPGVVSDRAAASKALAAELSKGTELKAIVEAAEKFKLYIAQMKQNDVPVAPPILETWLKFKWREMDAYFIYRNPVQRYPVLKPVSEKPKWWGKV